MTAKELTELGFSKKEYSGGYWYELKKGDHLFITNDNAYNKGKDDWKVGYEKAKTQEDTFWFNDNLTSAEMFKNVFHLMTRSVLKT